MVGLIGLCRISIFHKKVKNAYKKALKIKVCAEELTKEVIHINTISNFYTYNTFNEIKANKLEGQIKLLLAECKELYFDAYDLPLTNGLYKIIDQTNFVNTKSIKINPFDAVRILEQQINESIQSIKKLNFALLPKNKTNEKSKIINFQSICK